MTPDRRTEAALVAACLADDRDAWARLAETVRDGVRYTIVRTLRSHGASPDRHIVDDLEAQLLLGLMVDDARRLRQYRGDASLQGWVRVRAANLTIDHLRRRRRNVPVVGGVPEPGAVDLTSPDEPTDERLARAELLERLRGFFEALNAEDAEFARLFFVEEHSFDEISELTGATAGALYARKNRIRKKLTAMAEADGWFDLRHAARA